MGVKHCLHCDRDLPDEAYYVSKGHLSHYCRECTKEIHMIRYHRKRRGEEPPPLYTADELLCRPIEHVLEVFTYRQLSELWGVSEPEVQRIMSRPWELNFRTGEPNLSYEYRRKARERVESTL